MNMNTPTLDKVKKLLVTVLGSELDRDDINESTLLLGEVSELDSIAVVNVILAIEEQFEIKVEDDDIDATSFESVGSLTHFVDSKLKDTAR